MLKKLANLAKDSLKQTADGIINDITSQAEMQKYVSQIIASMDDGKDFWNWSRGYWQRYDTLGRVQPISDRKAYMKAGKSFKKGRIYKVGPMFDGEYSVGAPIADLGTVYNLDDLAEPARYAVAKNKDTVMLFNWIG